MKKILTLLLSLFILQIIAFGQHINEFHYDNAGGDVGEFVEVFIPDGDVNSYCVVLYNGSNGTSYNTTAVPTTCAGGTGVACGGTGTGCFIAIFISGIQNGAPDGIALVRDCGGGGETVIQFISYEGTLTATNGPANGMTSTDVGIAESSSTPIGNSLQLTGGGTWEANIATDGACNSSQLPISLTAFTATSVEDKAVMLNWTTASEENNEYYIVEHSRNGSQYEELELVKGAGTTYEEQNYTFMHDDAPQGNNYYRLRQVDFDGNFSYSPVRAVSLEAAASFFITPTAPKDFINLNLTDRFVDREGIVTIFDLNGRQLLVQRVVRDSQTQLDVSGLQQGHYFIRLEGSGTIETARFVKIN